MTYVEDDGYADDESGYSGDDDGDGFGDHNHSGSSLWAEDGSDLVWYEVIDAESGFPYWLHAVRYYRVSLWYSGLISCFVQRTGVSQWEPPLWLDQIDPASGTFPSSVIRASSGLYPHFDSPPSRSSLLREQRDGRHSVGEAAQFRGYRAPGPGIFGSSTGGAGRAGDIC